MLFFTGVKLRSQTVKFTRVNTGKGKSEQKDTKGEHTALYFQNIEVGLSKNTGVPFPRHKQRPPRPGISPTGYYCAVTCHDYYQPMKTENKPERQLKYSTGYFQSNSSIAIFSQSKCQSHNFVKVSY